MAQKETRGHHAVLVWGHRSWERAQRTRSGALLHRRLPWGLSSFTAASPRQQSCRTQQSSGACSFPACSVLWFGTYLVPKVRSCRDKIKRFFFISSCSLSLEQGHISRLCSETIPDKLNTDLEALGCLTLLLTDSLPSTSKLPSCCNVK